MEQKKEQGVVNQILQKQKIEEISAVSGATCSSQAICNLYRQALLMAANTDDKASDVKSSESPAVNSPKPEETLIPTPEPSYAPLQPLKMEVIQRQRRFCRMRMVIFQVIDCLQMLFLKKMHLRALKTWKFQTSQTSFIQIGH